MSKTDSQVKQAVNDQPSSPQTQKLSTSIAKQCRGSSKMRRGEGAGDLVKDSHQCIAGWKEPPAWLLRKHKAPFYSNFLR